MPLAIRIDHGVEVKMKICLVSAELAPLVPGGAGTYAFEMARALRDLPFQEKPSRINILGLLDGLSVINGMVDTWLSDRTSPAKKSLVKQIT